MGPQKYYMKAYDIEKKGYYKVISLDYDSNIIIMESLEHGRFTSTIDKVRLIQDRDEDMKGKSIITPELWWMIPFVGWFVVPYKLFTIDDCVIQAKSIKDQIIMLMIGFGPIFLILAFMVLTVRV